MNFDQLDRIRQRTLFLGLQVKLGMATAAEQAELVTLPIFVGGLVEGDPDGGVIAFVRPYATADEWLAASRAYEDAEALQRAETLRVFTEAQRAADAPLGVVPSGRVVNAKPGREPPPESKPNWIDRGQM